MEAIVRKPKDGFGAVAVQIGVAKVASFLPILGDLHDLLAHEERRRAARFRFSRDREMFVVGRGVLRALLGGYLGCRPRDIELEYGPAGKPSLNGVHEGRVRFNISHSAGIVLVAVSECRRVGVDIESMSSRVACDEVARSYFSPRENRMLSELPTDQRWAGFFSCWTRKEAYVKAAGGGLSIRLDSFDVSVAPTETRVQVRVLAELGRSQRWSIETLEIEPGYAAAVAYEGSPAKTGLFECRPDITSVRNTVRQPPATYR